MRHVLNTRRFLKAYYRLKQMFGTAGNNTGSACELKAHCVLDGSTRCTRLHAAQSRQVCIHRQMMWWSFLVESLSCKFANYPHKWRLQTIHGQLFTTTGTRTGAFSSFAPSFFHQPRKHTTCWPCWDILCPVAQLLLCTLPTAVTLVPFRRLARRLLWLALLAGCSRQKSAPVLHYTR